jgi:hypothetical protein
MTYKQDGGYTPDSPAGTISYKGKNYTGGKAEPKGYFGRGPTTAGTTGDNTGVSTAKTGKINGGATVKNPSNPDKINVGSRLTKGNE